nr:hypothetical protein [Endozoicomonas sp.]
MSCSFGCSLSGKNTESTDPLAAPSPQIMHSVEQDATMAYRDKERSGAAHNLQSYVHVLGQRETSPIEEYLPEKPPESPSDVLNVIDQIDGKDKLKSYSLYEVSQ